MKLVISVVSAIIIVYFLNIFHAVYTSIYTECSLSHTEKSISDSTSMNCPEQGHHRDTSTLAAGKESSGVSASRTKGQHV